MIKKLIIFVAVFALLAPSVSLAAIAFNGVSQSTTTGTSLTFSHTVAGSDTLLVVAIYTDSVGDPVTGVTYNSVSLTLTQKVTDPATHTIYIYHLLAPTTGANNVVVSTGSSVPIFAWAASYTGVKQTAQPDATTTNTATAQNITTSLTTVADNSWTMITGRISGAASTLSAGAGSTQRGTTDSQAGFFDSNAAITPAGSTSMTLNGTVGGTTWGTVMASFAPAASAPAAAPSMQIIRHR